MLIALTFTFTACGTNEDKRTSKKDSSSDEATLTGDCFGLDHSPGQSPYQGKGPVYNKRPVQKPAPVYEHRKPTQRPVYNKPVQQPKYKKGGPVIVRRPCDRPNQGQKYRPNQGKTYRPNQGKNIQPRPPVYRQPTQSCKSNCKQSAYQPIRPGKSPSNWPNQRPVKNGWPQIDHLLF